MNSTAKRMTVGDLLSLREVLELDPLGILWLNGSQKRQWSASLEDAQEYISDPSRGILIRYLLRYPDRSPLPYLPHPRDCVEAIKGIWPEFKTRRLGQFFGASDYSGYAWMAGGEASPVVRRLAYLFMLGIDEAGEAGFYDFMEVMEEEAQSRGFPDLTSVFRNSWQSKTENPKGVEGGVDRPPRMTEGDTDDLRELLQLDALGSLWLSGTMVREWGRGELRATDVIEDPTRSLIYRYLKRFPDRCPLGYQPNPTEITNELKTGWPEFKPARLGQLFGVTDGAAFCWRRGGQSAPIVRRLVATLLTSMEMVTPEVAMRDYLAVVEEEARAWGYENLHHLFRKGWQSVDKLGGGTASEEASESQPPLRRRGPKVAA